MTNTSRVAGLAASILWVEDDPDMREILADELVDSGYTVVQAVNGREALDCLIDFQPDLILCDIAMPVMDGYELLRSVRETMVELANVPFVFLSAQDGSDQITQGKYAGADDYLVKPVNFDLMLATIAARIRQVRRMRSQIPHGSLPASASPPNRAFSTVASGQTLQGLARMFNLITAGIILLDRQGRVLFANIAAQQLMLDCADPAALGLFGVGSELKEKQASSPMIRTAIEAGLQGKEYTEFLSLPRRNEQRDLLVTLCALDCREEVDDALAAALFIGADDRDAPAPLKALESLFKLTPAEGRIAWAFAQGLKPEQISGAFNITLTTIAFHKRNIFQKTQTNRQADLIILLLTLPASFESR